MPSPLRALRKLTSKLADARRNHATRRTATGFKFAVAEDVRFLNPAHWDLAAAAGGFFMSRAYLEVLADHAPENLSPRCALIYDEGEPVAAIAAQVVEITGTRLVKADSKPAPATGKRALLKKALAPLGRKAVTKLEERVLVCGNLLSWGGHGVSFAPGVEPSVVWPAVTEALYRIRRAEKLMGDTALLVIKDLVESEMPASEALRTYSYRPLQTDPNMVLEFRSGWRSYDDYFASLDRKYQKSVRQLSEAAAEAGVTFELLQDLAPYEAVLHGLYLQVHRAATVQPVTIPPGYLPALARAAGEGFRCTVARKDGQIVGFVTSVRDGETTIGYYIGYDRELAAQGAPLYLKLLHSTIEHALAFGCKRLSLGRTALEPKARLGAKPVPLHLWTRHRVPAMNWLLRAALRAVPHEEAPERNPFRKEV